MDLVNLKYKIYVKIDSEFINFACQSTKWIGAPYAYKLYTYNLLSYCF